MVRIADVAAHAGVSTATVSRVLNGVKVRSDLENRVRLAVAELDYAPNRTARSLRRQLSDVIALIIPDVENPFFTSVARGVEDVARAAGLSVVLCNADDDVAKERLYLAVAEHENMAGVILAPAGDAAPDLSRLIRRDRAVVVIDRAVGEDVDQVVFDNYSLGRRAAEGLIARGHRDIACITGPRTTPTAVERATGWRDALEEAGLSSSRLVYANFRVDGGRSAMADLLAAQTPPEAVLATNNLVGVGVLQVLAGRSGPHVDVGIIGDLPFATSDVDEVFHLSLQPREMGVTAARLLVDRIHGSAAAPETKVLLGAP